MQLFASCFYLFTFWNNRVMALELLNHVINPIAAGRWYSNRNPDDDKSYLAKQVLRQLHKVFLMRPNVTNFNTALVHGKNLNAGFGKNLISLQAVPKHILLNIDLENGLWLDIFMPIPGSSITVMLFLHNN